MKKYYFLFLLFVSCLSLRGQKLELRLPIGHFAGVKTIEFSKDGKLLLSTEWFGNSAKIWEVATGKLLQSIETLNGLEAAHFCPDSKSAVVAAGRDGIVKIVDISTGLALPNRYYKFDENVKDACVSPNGFFLAISTDSIVIISDSANNILYTIKAKGIRKVEFAPDSKAILAIPYYGTCELLDVFTGKPFLDNLQEIKVDSPNEVSTYLSPRVAAFSNDGKKVVIGHYSGIMELWNINLRKSYKISRYISEIKQAKFNSDGHLLLTIAADSIARVWETESGKEIFNFNQLKVTSADFAQDRSCLYLAMADGSITVRNIKDWKLRHSIPGHKSGINELKFVQQPHHIATASNDRTIKLWDAFSGKILVNFSGHTDYLSNVEIFDDNSFFTVNYDYLKFWDFSTGKFLGRIQNGFFNPKVLTKPNSNRIIIYSEGNGEDTGIIQLYDSKLYKEVAILTGHTSSISHVGFDNAGDRIITGSKDGSARLWDAKKGSLLHILDGHKSTVWSTDFNQSGTKVLTASRDSTVILWDTETGKPIKQLIGCGNYPSQFRFSPDDSKIITIFNNCIKIWDSLGTLLSSIQLHSSYTSFHFSGDGKGLLSYSDSLVVISSLSNYNEHIKLPKQRVSFAYFSEDATKVITIHDTIVKCWNARTGTFLFDLKGHHSYVRGLIYGTEKNRIITYSDGDTFWEWDIENGLLVRQYNTGHTLAYHYGDIDTSKNILLYRENAQTTFVDAKTGDELMKFIVVDSTDWICLHPSGLFDASAGAMDKLYWVNGLETIDFGQMKNRYWQPGLFGMVMQRRPLRNVFGMTHLGLQPELEVDEVKNGILTIRLVKREGGYGKVSVNVNYKEVLEDARPEGFDPTFPTQTIKIDLTRYLLPGMDNDISVKAWDANEFISSKGVTITHKSSVTISSRKPAFYAIICGTSEYSNPSLNLTFPVPDAQAMAKAISIGAENEFGKDSIFIYLLTSPGTIPTTKENIKLIFEKVKRRAKPEDVVLVYISGHGLTWGGTKGDFYYLTSDASSGGTENFADPMLRERQSISTIEFTKWLNAIPALKQVMIIDACGSGKAVDNLLASRKDIDASQIRAMDRMKDRTGLYIISGCASDAVSYEASRYGQGLLTYAILQAIKGAALKDGIYVDIMTIFNHARDVVPLMAKGIGGIQQPQLLFPKAGSFDIGIIKEKDKVHIPLARLKPVFTKSTLYEETKKRDILRLSQALNDKLANISSIGTLDKGIVFINSDDFPEACNVSGGYTIEKDRIIFSGSVLCGESEKNFQLSAATKEELVEIIFQKVINIISMSK